MIYIEDSVQCDGKERELLTPFATERWISAVPAIYGGILLAAVLGGV